MNQRIKALLFFMLQPTWVFAHGEEVLLPFFLSLVSLLHFFVVILLVSLPYIEKAILVAVYLTTMGLAFFWGNEVYYQLDIILITIVTGLAPITTTVLAYFMMRARRRKQSGE